MGWKGLDATRFTRQKDPRNQATLAPQSILSPHMQMMEEEEEEEEEGEEEEGTLLLRHCTRRTPQSLLLYQQRSVSRHVYFL